MKCTIYSYLYKLHADVLWGFDWRKKLLFRVPIQRLGGGEFGSWEWEDETWGEQPSIWFPTPSRNRFIEWYRGEMLSAKEAIFFQGLWNSARIVPREPLAMTFETESWAEAWSHINFIRFSPFSLPLPIIDTEQLRKQLASHQLRLRANRTLAD